MRKLVVYDLDVHKQLPQIIIKEIIETSKKNYGCKFISRETGNELDYYSIQGLFVDAVTKILEKV